MRLDPRIRQEILDLIPNLRAFAASMTGSTARADELVKSTILLAIADVNGIEPGTALRPRLFTILRDFYRADARRLHDEPTVTDFVRARLQRIHKTVLDADMQSALARLCDDHREALLLVCAEGMSLEEAAGICSTSVPTMKNRVLGARSSLAGSLDLEVIAHLDHDAAADTSAPLHSA